MKVAYNKEKHYYYLENSSFQSDTQGVEIGTDDYRIVPVGDGFYSNFCVVRYKDKLGLFGDNNESNYHDYPFLYDEIWVSSSFSSSKNLGYIAYRIGEKWGVKIYDLDNNLYFEDILPCEFLNMKELVSQVKEAEYPWENPFNSSEQVSTLSERNRVRNREEIITLLRGTNRQGIETVIQFMKDKGFLVLLQFS